MIVDRHGRRVRHRADRHLRALDGSDRHWPAPASTPRSSPAETFNFLYTEHTQTLNWPTWVLYLTLPIFAVSMTIHGLANLLEDLELVPRTPPKGFALSELDGVN